MSNVPGISPISSEIDKIRHTDDADDRLLEGDDRDEQATNEGRPSDDPASPGGASEEEAAD